MKKIIIVTLAVAFVALVGYALLPNAPERRNVQVVPEDAEIEALREKVVGTWEALDMSPSANDTGLPAVTYVPDGTYVHHHSSFGGSWRLVRKRDVVGASDSLSPETILLEEVGDADVTEFKSYYTIEFFSNDDDSFSTIDVSIPSRGLYQTYRRI